MSAQARAARRLAAQHYAGLPTAASIEADKEYERARQQSIAALDQNALQRAQFAGMVLGNPEVAKNLSKEQLAEIVPEAIAFVKKLLHQGHEMMLQRDRLAGDDDDPETVDEA